MWKCFSWIPVVVVAVCLPVPKLFAQDLTADMSALKLLTLNDLSLVVGMVSGVDRISVTIMKPDRTTVDVPRSMVMKVEDIYMIVSDGPDMSKPALDSSTCTLELIGDVSVTGWVLEAGPPGVTLRQMDGKCIRVPSSAIKNMDEACSRAAAEADAGLDTVMADPGNFALFLAPTGRAQRHRGVTLSLWDAVACGASLGIADMITLSGGVLPFAGLAGAAKFTIPGTEWVYVSGGLIAFRHDDRIISPFVATTFGNDDISLTTDLVAWENRTSILIIGVEFRTGNSVRFISENWFGLSKSESETYWRVLSFGVRINVGRNMTCDFGGFIMHHKSGTTSGEHDDMIPLPWASVSLHL
jgi:hypothetical protein